MKAIRIKQHDITDCGAACIASVSASYGLKLPLAQIRQYAYTNKKGTNILGMVDALSKLGFKAKGVRAEFEALNVIPKPTIAHVTVKKVLKHFVVIYKVSNTKLKYMDPSDGKMHEITHDEFRKMWTGILILVEPKETFEATDKTTSNTKRFWELFRPHRGALVQSLFGAIIVSILGLSTSIYVGKITDYVFVDGNTNLLNMMSIVMIAILLLKVFIGLTKNVIMVKTGQSIDVALILGYYKHLLTLPQQFFDTMRVGEITSRVGDAVKIRNLVNNVVVELTVNIMILVFTVVLMLIYSWKLTLILVASTPFYGILFFAFNRLNRKYQRKIMERGADLQAQLVESLESIGTIKRFGIENFTNAKTENRFIAMLRGLFTATKGALYVNNGIQIVEQGMVIAVLWIGSSQVIDQSITPGTLMMFYSLVGYVASPISSIISSNSTIQEALIASDRLFQIMDLEREENDSNKITLTTDMIGDICFDNITFRYGSRKFVFEDFSLTIQKGKITAIVGESGSGKTTLISLLQNIYPIHSGKIKIGDYDIAIITNKSLREKVSVVPQQVELFAGTVTENIALGKTNPDLKRIVDVIKSLGLEQFIDGLPQGLNTRIGEHGTSLSGGECQRLAIARAVYRNPEIILFDEATSSLDTLAEKYVKQVTKQLASEGKTIVIIAHRLSTVRDADTIVTINHGKVIETGTHAELLAKGGVYSMLWDEQTAGNNYVDS